MEEFDIEAYLDGTMNLKEKEALETAMKHNPDLAKEVNFLRQLTEDVKMVGLREEVSAALASSESGRFSYRWLAIPMILGFITIYFLFFQKKIHNKTSNIESPNMVQPLPIPETQEEISPVLEKETPKDTLTTPVPKTPIKKKKRDVLDQPIAQTKPSRTLPPPVFPAPNIRGQQTNTESQSTLLNSIWYTVYPPKDTQFPADFDKIDQLLKDRDFSKAYVRIQFLERKMPNDIQLLYVKGYCLLEMGEGREALRTFEQLEKITSQWSAEMTWYKGLAFLMTNNPSQARAAFQSISRQDNHPFQQEALKALNLMK